MSYIGGLYGAAIAERSRAQSTGSVAKAAGAGRSGSQKAPASSMVKSKCQKVPVRLIPKPKREPVPNQKREPVPNQKREPVPKAKPKCVARSEEIREPVSKAKPKCVKRSTEIREPVPEKKAKKEPVLKREPVIVPSAPESAEKFKLTCPGWGGASDGQDVALNVQEVVTKEDGNANFMLVPTTAKTDEGLELPTVPVTIRGRKTSVSFCDHGECGQCRRCKAKAFWQKSGEKLAKAVMSVHGDKQCVWASWKETGVGCLLCHNYKIALDVERTTAARRKTRPCPWQHFAMLVFKKETLARHAETDVHQQALFYHATGKKHIEVFSKPEKTAPDENGKHVPTPFALRKLVVSIANRMSRNAYIKSEQAIRTDNNFEGFISKESCARASYCLAETLRQQWRARLPESRISIASDAAGRVDVLDFRAFDTVRGEVWEGTFGLARHGRTDGEKIKRMSPQEEAKHARQLATSLTNIIKAFCTEGSYYGYGGAKCKGALNDDLFKAIKDNVLFTVFDGANYAQNTGRILCTDVFKKALTSEKDNFHDFLRITGQAAQKDTHFEVIHRELFAKQHAIIKDLHYAPKVKDMWLRCQQTVLDRDGHQGGRRDGPQAITTRIQYMPYAPTRATVEPDCFEVFDRTMIACLMTMAERCEDQSKEIRSAYTKTMDSFSDSIWARIGLNSDKKVVERVTARHFDESGSFQPMKTRILEDYMRTIWYTFHTGMVAADLNDGTLTRVVLDTIRTAPAIQYGQKVVSMSEKGFLEAMPKELERIQNQNKATFKILEQHNCPKWFINKSQCFDLYRWNQIDERHEVVFPWRGSGDGSVLKYNDHRKLLLEQFSFFAKQCGATASGVDKLFEAWCAKALYAWKKEKRQENSEYNGDIMLLAWVETFKTLAADTQMALKPVMGALGVIHRNTATVERTLKQSKALEKSEGPEITHQRHNDEVLVRKFIARDPQLLADDQSAFYTQFCQNWRLICGKRWNPTRKKRRDAGTKHKQEYNYKSRYRKSKLSKSLFKNILKLAERGRSDRARQKTKTFAGQSLDSVKDARPFNTDGFSAKQLKYIEHHCTKGGDVKRRKTEEKQRLRGKRWCAPVHRFVPPKKAPAPALPGGELKVRFPKGFMDKHGIPESDAWVVTKDMYDADVIAVDKISQLNVKGERPFKEGTIMAYTGTALVARILGKRVAEPEFFKKLHLRHTEGQSNNLREARHWAAHLSYKCRPACTCNHNPKLALQVTSAFRTGDAYKILTLAAAMDKSRWKLIKPREAAGAKFQLKTIDNLKDMSDLLDACPDFLDSSEKDNRRRRAYTID